MCPIISPRGSSPKVVSTKERFQICRKLAVSSTSDGTTATLICIRPTVLWQNVATRARCQLAKRAAPQRELSALGTEQKVGQGRAAARCPGHLARDCGDSSPTQRVLSAFANVVSSVALRRLGDKDLAQSVEFPHTVPVRCEPVSNANFSVMIP
ncbi:hypothetical protein BD309DRAFT_457923 [Dichomitus squalens]|uniref:Uncharacterized protein n=1 Tax=Dichomitus squalens TaxID=114155 RepID=A0A4Q9P069_9APHY|nr:hypothetical protein BD309DRAFT_457923 [Dichomitus squalens]TBU57759.1 hypothetical protein BD310DRAFT_533644 [Dichomitus squalens]